MSLTVNGKALEIDEGANLVELLERLGLSADQPGIAVAVNEAVVPHSRWSEHRLAEGDRVEIIHPVQGG